jgi:AraC-like DNA-binding protein/mannose-6-phosphate isomerase-like protein (cupin superfamily)
MDGIELVRCTLQPRQRGAGSPHSHPAYEFHLVVAGRGTFCSDGAAPIACSPGAAWYTAPGVRHHIDSIGDKPLLQYITHVRLAPATATVLKKAWPACLPIACNAADDSWLWGVQERLRRDNAHARQSAAHRFAAWLHDILERRASPESVLPPAVVRLRSALMSAPHRAPSLASIARAAGVSVGHAVRLCRAHLGATPVAWHRRWRLETASRWLAASDLPVQEIGAMAGFPDPFHFSRAFRAFARMSPSAWRMAHGVQRVE